MLIADIETVIIEMCLLFLLHWIKVRGKLDGWVDGYQNFCVFAEFSLTSQNYWDIFAEEKHSHWIAVLS